MGRFADRGLGLHLDDPRYDLVDKRLRISAAPPGLIVTKNRDKWLAPIKDQKRSNGCVGFSGSTAIAWAEFLATGKTPPLYSPLFGWALARGVYGDWDRNVGCMIRDFALVARTYGICSEDRWPFEDRVAGDYLARLGTPSLEAYEEAARHQTLGDFVIGDGDTDGMKDALDRGFGFQFGFPVYESFDDTPADGVATADSGQLRGWHAVYCWDADVINGKQYFWCDNSWGTTFGKAGRFALSESQMRKVQDVRVYTKMEIV